MSGQLTRQRSTRERTFARSQSYLRAVRILPAILVALAMWAETRTPSYAATGTIRIVITRAGFIVGNGSGTLHFQGNRYPLRIGGVNFGPLEAAGVDLLGRVYYLRNAASIHGIYSVVAVAKVGQANLVRLRNWHGVVLELRGRRGVKPSVDLSGMEISLRH